MLTRRLSAWNREVAGAAILAVFFGCMVESGIARSHKESLSYIDAFSLCHQAEPMSSQNQKDDHGVVPNSHQPGILDFEKEWQEDLHPEDTSRFQLVKQLGNGAQGSVVAARELATGRMVAIKQVKPAFGEKSGYGLRTLRELAHLRALNSSDYIVDMVHAFLPRNRESFNSVYFATELMGATMSSKTVSAQFQALAPEKQKELFFDVLSALEDMHNIGIYHRDMAARNIVAGDDCNFKLIDLGVSGPAVSTPQRDVNTSPYHARSHITSRPPELLPNSPGIDWRAAFDIWATACAFLKLMHGSTPRMCITGERTGHQAARHIVRVLGMPSSETIAKYRSQAGRRIFRSMGKNYSSHFTIATGLAAKYPELDSRLLALVQRMFHLDPDNRPNATELLKDPVFSGMARTRRFPGNEKDSTLLMEPLIMHHKGFSVEDYRRMVYLEILTHYRHATDGIRDMNSS